MNSQNSSIDAAGGINWFSERETAPAFKPISNQTANKNIESKESAALFAKGLPAWDITPPQVVVRRRGGK